MLIDLTRRSGSGESLALWNGRVHKWFDALTNLRPPTGGSLLNHPVTFIDV